MDKSNVSAVILAGGRATRMGGNDKGLVEVNGQPLVQVIADQLLPQVDTLLINANRNQQTYRELGFEVMQDDLPDYQGPLAGMLAALKCIQTDWLLTLPCDGPYVDTNYVQKMVDAVNHSSLQLAVASDGERLQPVYALIHRNLISSLDAYLASGERKIDRWYAEVGFTTVSFAQGVMMFTNLNTPEQLAEIQHH